MKKVIKLTEAQLVEVIKNVIEEQKVMPKSTPIKNLVGKIDAVFPGQTAQGEIMVKNNKKILTITTESGNTQSMYVNTNLPVGGFMFELGKDGKRMYGYESKSGKKIEIFPL